MARKVYRADVSISVYVGENWKRNWHTKIQIQRGETDEQDKKEQFLGKH